MNPPIDLPLAELVPPPALFLHPSLIHGQAHVARVMVHAFRLIAATGWSEEARRLWAAVYLHDLARTHDDVCYVHGRRAVERLGTLPALKELFARGGVRDHDYEAIEVAVIHHCLSDELPRTHRHWRLASLLKDADALDRVRVGDLDPSYLRHDASRHMLRFAHALFDETDGAVDVGHDHFERLWPEALRILSDGRSSSSRVAGVPRRIR